MTSKWNVAGASEMPHADTPFDEPFDKPFYSVYETLDAKHLVVGAYEPKFWKTLCEVLSITHWLDRQWVSGAEEDELRDVLKAAFLRKTQDEWLRIFSRHDACVTPVRSMREALNSPQAIARGSVITVEDPTEGTLRHIACPIRFDGVAPSCTEPCPSLGGQTDAVLAEAGFSPTRVAALRTAGAI